MERIEIEKIRTRQRAMFAYIETSRIQQTNTSLLEQQYAEDVGNLLSLIEEQRNGFKRISECGVTGEDARDMHLIAEEFI